MCISHVFICCHETASEHQFLFQTCGKQLQEYTKCLKLLMEIKLYLTKMIKVVGSCRTLKIQELLAKDQRIILKLIVNQLHIKTDTIQQILHEHLEKRKTYISLFHKTPSKQEQHRVTIVQASSWQGGN